MVMLGLPAGRSLWTPMEDGEVTEEELSLARTALRLTDQLPTLLGGSLKTCAPMDSARDAWFRLLIVSGLLNLSASTLTVTTPSQQVPLGLFRIL